jgi:hypothetical protein
LALERLTKREVGKLAYRLNGKKKDGAKEVMFRPMDLLRRLSALVPHPKTHGVSYGGVFAAHAKLRGKIVPGTKGAQRARWEPDEPEAMEPSVKAPEPYDRYLPWAELLRRA